MGDSIKIRVDDARITPRFERRTIPRLKSNKALVYTAKGAYFTGRALHLSAHGIRMRVRHELEAGNVVVILLKKAGIYRSEHYAKVLEVRPAGDSWVIECEFAKPLSQEDLHGLQV